MKQYYIIDDLDGVLPYSLDVETVQKTKEEIIDLFKETFPTDEIIFIAYQDAKSYFQQVDGFTIDLEGGIFIQSDFDFSITRTYTDENLSGPYTLLTRDGKTIITEMERLKTTYKNKKGKPIAIIDGCIFSGDTIKIVTKYMNDSAILANYIKVLVNNSGESTICGVPIQSLYTPKPSEVIDILDMRDIVPGTKYGGASVQGGKSVWYGKDIDILERKLSIPSDKATLFKNKLDEILEKFLLSNEK